LSCPTKNFTVTTDIEFIETGVHVLHAGDLQSSGLKPLADELLHFLGPRRGIMTHHVRRGDHDLGFSSRGVNTSANSPRIAVPP